MKKMFVSVTAVMLTSVSVLIAQATEYAFPTGMSVNLERDDVPAYKAGSTVVYPVVNYFSVQMPNGDENFVLKNEAGETLTVSMDGDRYFVDAEIPAGQVVYFGPNADTVAQPIRVMLNGPINIGHVHFASGSSALTAETRKALRLVAKEMKDSNLTSAYLVGMTDRSGSETANLTLSEKRANVAATYLNKKLAELGVTNSSVTTENMGEYLSEKRDGTVNPFDRKVSILIYPTV
jgi:outer membrane protein OmpA-like peptidoglycan-associated protein